MPTYEYRCEKCNQTFETFQSMKDSPFAICPESLCQMETWGQGKVKRLFGTGAGLIFKGSGFYTTDYRSSSYQEAAKKETEGSTKTGAGDAKKEPAKTESAKSEASKSNAGDTGSKGSSGSGSSKQN